MRRAPADRTIAFCFFMNLLFLNSVTGASAQGSRTDTATAYIERGRFWVMKGDYEKADADFNLAVVSDPRLADAYSNRGLVRYYRKDFDAALSDFDKALQLNPRLADAWMNRGAVRSA